MPEESAEASIPPEQYNKKVLNLLAGIAVMLVILMIGLVLAALGFLLYGLIAGKLAVSIIGVVACVLGFGLLFGLFRLLLDRSEELAGAPTDGLRGRFTEALTAGRETYSKVQEELRIRYPEQEEKRRKRRETYARVKDELSTRYGHPKVDEDSFTRR